MKPMSRVGSGVILKIMPEGGDEKIIGFCTSVALSINQGSKALFGVDSPFPTEIAAGAAASQVGVQMSCILLKGSTLESLGLVPFRTSASSEKDGGNASDQVWVGTSKYLHIRLYDRESQEMFYGADYCKVNSCNIIAQSKSVVRAEISFTGMYLVPGNG